MTVRTSNPHGEYFEKKELIHFYVRTEKHQSCGLLQIFKNYFYSQTQTVIILFL